MSFSMVFSDGRDVSSVYPELKDEYATDRPITNLRQYRNEPLERDTRSLLTKRRDQIENSKYGSNPLWQKSLLTTMSEDNRPGSAPKPKPQLNFSRNMESEADFLLTKGDDETFEHRMQTREAQAKRQREARNAALQKQQEKKARADRQVHHMTSSNASGSRRGLPANDNGMRREQSVPNATGLMAKPKPGTRRNKLPPMNPLMSPERTSGSRVGSKESSYGNGADDMFVQTTRDTSDESHMVGDVREEAIAPDFHPPKPKPGIRRNKLAPINLSVPTEAEGSGSGASVTSGSSGHEKRASKNVNHDRTRLPSIRPTAMERLEAAGKG